jgi:O-antigen/teichoic acid export membrane protein
MKFVLGDFIKFLMSNIFYQGVILISDFYLLRIIDKELVGLWQYALLLQTYTLILRLGIINSFNRQYPYYLALENNSDAKKLYDTTFYFVKFNTVVQFLFFVICGLIVFLLYDNKLLGMTLLVMAVYSVLDSFNNFQEAVLRNVGNLSGINIAKLAAAFTALILIVFPYSFGFVGYLVRIIFLVLIPCLVMLFFTRFNWKTSFSWIVWRDLLSDGWKFWLWGYAKTVLKSIPRVYIVSFGSFSTLGLYAPVNWLLLSFSLVTGSLNAYLYPILSTQAAKGEKDLSRNTFKINLILFLSLFPFVFLGCLLLPRIINSFLPGYIEAIVPMQVMLVASLFEVFSVSTTLWASKGEWKKIFINQVFSLISTTIVFTCVQFINGSLLLNVSYAVLAVSFINAVVISILMHRESK